MSTSIYLPAQKIIREDWELLHTKIQIDSHTVEEQKKKFTAKMDFESALSLSLQSFFEDEEDLESPLTLIKEMSPSNPDPKALLRKFVNQGSIILIPEKEEESPYPFPPRGENISENWIFGLDIQISDYCHWAIVERNGNKAPYNYGFN